MNNKDSVDMLHGPLISKIIFFAIPVALSSMLQQLFNAADTSVVGHFADAGALASVGTNGEIVALLVTVSAGLSVGANVMCAHRIGENKREEIPAIMRTAILFAIVAGILIGLGGILSAKPILKLIKTPADAVHGAVIYLRIYCAGMPFLMLYDFGSALLRAHGNSKLPFIALTVSGVLNVLLNLLFVIVMHLGVAGVALATDISTAVSAAIVLFKLRPFCRGEKIKPSGHILLHILGIGIPSAIQGAVFCFANIFVQASVNSFGSIATSGSTIAMNFEYFGYYMITAFGQAATTFTSQNYAAGLMKRCRKVLLICLLFSVLLSGAIIVPITVFRYNFSRIFSADPAVIQAACTRIMIVLIWEPICCLYEIPAGFMRGTGRSMLPAIMTVIGTCALRIIWIFTVFRQNNTPETLFTAFPVSWVLTIILMGAAMAFTFYRIKKE